MTNPVLLIIRGYQKYLSPLFGRRCRYHPTCSDYAMSAIRANGTVRGIALGVWRILRCNPFTAGGVDYAPNAAPITYRQSEPLGG